MAPRWKRWSPPLARVIEHFCSSEPVASDNVSLRAFVQNWPRAWKRKAFVRSCTRCGFDFLRSAVFCSVLLCSCLRGCCECCRARREALRVPRWVPTRLQCFVPHWLERWLGAALRCAAFFCSSLRVRVRPCLCSCRVVLVSRLLTTLAHAVACRSHLSVRASSRMQF